MKTRLLSLLLLCSAILAARGEELQPLLTTTGKTLVTEDFSGTEIPKSFFTLESAASFSMADGALQAVSRAGQTQSTHGVLKVTGHDITVAFAMKFVVPGNLCLGFDGYKKTFNGNTHLVRFSITPDRVAWDEHRGGPESKHAVADANRAARAAKQSLPQQTAEQLADPEHFRIEDLAARPFHCSPGEWHQVLLEVSGNELVAQVDGQKLAATAVEADSMKSRLGIGLTGRGTVLIKNMRISENTRRADWQDVKAKLAAAP
jgi:hypothetical protein